MADHDLTVELLPILSDNYAFLIRRGDDPGVAIVDPGEPAPIEAVLKQRGLQLNTILLTHHHADHIDGVPELIRHRDVEVIGNSLDHASLPGLSRTMTPGERFELMGTPVEVLDTPGHCEGHISYFLPEAKALFCGDVLFTMGCGRIGEGQAATMWRSLQLLNRLPGDTVVYSGHEYTMGNAKFSAHAFPDNREIADRLKKVEKMRAEGQPTVPTKLEEERRTNPFLLAGSSARFAELRAAKDGFRG